MMSTMFIVEAVVGFLTGVLASMGLGGGFVLVLWLTLAENVTQRTAQGVNVLFFLPIAFLALLFHMKSGLVNKNLVKKMLLGGILGAVLGTLGTHLVPQELLRKLYAIFLLVFGVKELFAKGKEPNASDNDIPNTADNQ